jgi:hypothetical protein
MNRVLAREVSSGVCLPLANGMDDDAADNKCIYDDEVLKNNIDEESDSDDEECDDAFEHVDSSMCDIQEDNDVPVE